ncbi:hypothetical protein K8I85_15695, partial [bacterium]|nr:hypothetical protein [bacterium]
ALRALERNPFLRPAGSSARKADAGSAAPQRRPTLTLTGTRTGSRPMAIIDDRTLHIGDTVRGRTVRSIGRDRVTLENPDGTTFDLDLR